MQRFYGIISTIKLNDFIIEFGALYNDQAKKNLRFNLYNS